jgi:F-type H+-transporting ATPase subunit alpha
VSPELFRRGVLPPVDVGKSVSRVGGKTQLPAYRSVAGPLRLAHSQFEELEAFSRFATRLDEQTRVRIERGRRVREALKQGEHSPLRPAEQVAVLYAAGKGLFDDIASDRNPGAERGNRDAVGEHCAELCERIERGEKLGDSDWQALEKVERNALEGHGRDARANDSRDAPGPSHGSAEPA